MLEFADSLRKISLHDVSLLKESLLTDAIDLAGPEVQQFINSLEDGAWSADDVLNFQSQPSYAQITQDLPDIERIRIRRELREFLQGCIETEIYRQLHPTPPESSAAREMAILNRTEDLIRQLMFQSQAPQLHPLPLETMRVGLARLYHNVRAGIERTVQGEREAIRNTMHTKGKKARKKERFTATTALAEAEREREILPILLELREELRSFTDPQFLVQEMAVRLRERHPDHAEALLKRFLIYLSQTEGSNYARQQPNFLRANLQDQNTLTAEIQKRYIQSVGNVLGMRNLEV